MVQAILITGASAGIGRTTAKKVRTLGYHVLNLDIAPSDDDCVETHRVDLMDAVAVDHALAELSARHEIVGLVNNAAYARTAPLEDTDAPLMDATFLMNLTVPALCAKALVPAMKARGYGRIVNVSSRSAQGRELRTAYASSKGGLIAMTRVWALELSRYGITSNCVAPGPISTEMFDRMNPEGSSRRAKMVAEIPAGRMGRPEDVAGAVAFFLSPESGFVSGQTLYVCGGLSAGRASL